MKKQITINLKTLLKVAGVVVGIFLVLIVVNFLTNFKSSDSLEYSTKSSSRGIFNAPMSSTGSKNTVTEQITEDATYQNSDTNQQGELTEKKIIKNGNLSLKVKQTEQAVEEITSIVRNQAGEVFSTNFYERIKGQKSGSMTVKVPVNKFKATLEEIKKTATQVVSESTTGQDVTERYTDLEAQLKNKKAEEESVLKILDQAKEIEDVLAVTKQLSRVRGEIERLEGQLRFMDSQTDMSTIVIEISEDIEISPVQNDWRPWEVTKKAFSDLIVRSQDFVDNTIRFIIIGVPSLIPTLIIVWIVYWVGKKVWSKFRK